MYEGGKTKRVKRVSKSGLLNWPALSPGFVLIAKRAVWFPKANWGVRRPKILDEMLMSEILKIVRHGALDSCVLNAKTRHLYAWWSISLKSKNRSIAYFQTTIGTMAAGERENIENARDWIPIGGAAASSNKILCVIEQRYLNVFVVHESLRFYPN